MTLSQLSDQRGTCKPDLYEYRKETMELPFKRVIQACDWKIAA